MITVTVMVKVQDLKVGDVLGDKSTVKLIRPPAGVVVGLENRFWTIVSTRGLGGTCLCAPGDHELEVAQRAESMQLAVEEG